MSVFYNFDIKMEKEMKKIILSFLLFMVGFSSIASEIVSQESMIKQVRPLLEKAETYEKYKLIEAKEAKGGEIILTITSDGLETQNTAEKGDYIIRSLTEAGEEYIIKKEKFTNRYKYFKKGENGFKIYKPIGKIKAIVISQDILDLLKVNKEFFFVAPWGQEMIAKKGDYLVSPLDYSEVYRIAEKEFFETYQKEK